MINKNYLVLLTVFSLLLISCEGPKGDAGPTGPSGTQGLPGDSDKQIRFDLGGGFGTSSTTPFMFDEVYSLIKFNVYNYTGVDSVVLYGILQSSNSNTNCIVDLYNWTDDVVIAESEIRSNSTSLVWVSSSNIFNELPNKEISLALRIRSENEGIFVTIDQGLLFLFRN
jgi:hypothetical protein